MGSIKGVATLKKREEFDRVYKKGRAVHSPYFVIFYRPSDTVKVGFVASKKLGKAVKRNRAKRLLRALVINSLDSLKSGSYIFVAKPKILEIEFQKLSKNFLRSLQKV